VNVWTYRLDDSPPWAGYTILQDKNEIAYLGGGYENGRQTACAICEAHNAAISAPSAVRDVLAERQRQIETNEPCSLQLGELQKIQVVCRDEQGLNYSLYAPLEFIGVPYLWQWMRWKPNDSRNNLVKAAAFTLAEIERLDRATAKEKA
jgi:hypothetical protein